MFLKFIKKLNVLVLPFLLSLLVHTVEPVVVQATEGTIVTSSGSITVPGTYRINSISGLQALAEVVNDGSGLSGYTFILISDLDLTGINWMPIGDNYAFDNELDNVVDRMFEGIFDGSGHTVSNLTIDNRDISNPQRPQQFNGLFGVTSGAFISNLVIENVRIGLVYPVNSSTGAVVGKSINSTVSGVTVSGTIQINAIGPLDTINNLENRANVASFIGENYSIGANNVSRIYNSHVIVSTITNSGSQKIAGFVGSNRSDVNGESIIDQSSLSASILTLCGLNRLGGFVGSSEGNGAIIRNSSLFVSGLNITGQERSGGFIGVNESIIEEVQVEIATINIDGTANSDTRLGGFVGFNTGSNATIRNSSFFVSGLTITGEEQLGGFVGVNKSIIEEVQVEITIININGVDNELGGFVGFNEKNAAVIRNSRLIASGLTITGQDELGGFGGVNEGIIEEVQLIITTIHITGTRDKIAGFVGLNDYSFSNSNPALISGVQLFVSGLSIIGRDILGGFVAENEGVIEEIIIRVTTIDITGTEDKISGFVGFNDRGNWPNNQPARIAGVQLFVSGMTIVGRDELGGFGGLNEGYIENSNLSITTISITGTLGLIGGFVGFNDFSTINNHPAIISGVQLIVSGITVTGEDELGGFVGENEGPIENISFFNSSVVITGTSGLIGGFVGHNYGTNARLSNIDFNSSSLTLDGEDEIGGFVGHNFIGTFSNSHMNADSINITASYDGEAYNGGFVGKHDSGLIENVSITTNSLSITNPLGNGNGGFAGWTSSQSVIDSGLLQATTINIDGDMHVGGFVGNLRGTINNVKLFTDTLVMSGVETLGGFVGLQRENATINQAQMTIDTGSLFVSSGIIGGFIGHQNDVISDSWFTVVVNEGLTFQVQGLSPRTTGTIVSLPFTTQERVDQGLEGEAATSYNGAFVGKYTSGLITLIAEPPRQTEPAPTPTPPTPPAPAPIAPSNPPRTTTRSLVREILLTVSDLTMNVGDPIGYPVATAIERVGFIDTDVSDLIVRTGEIGSAVGSYEITYTVTSNGVTQSQTVRVHVVDTIPPQIVYTGIRSLYVDEIFEPTFETSDNAAGPVTVLIEETPDVTRSGETQLIAVATDVSGNQTRLVVPITVLQERIVVRDITVNQASVLFVLNSRTIEIETTVFFTALASSEPAVNASIWVPYTNTPVQATQANQFVYVKAQDALGRSIVGTPIPLTFQSDVEPIAVFPILETTPSEIAWGGVVLAGAATIVLAAVLYWQRELPIQWIKRFVFAVQRPTHKSISLASSFFLLFGIRREYDVCFYDRDELVSKQRIQRGASAKAPFDAKWDQPFDEVKDDLIIRKIR